MKKSDHEWPAFLPRNEFRELSRGADDTAAFAQWRICAAGTGFKEAKPPSRHPGESRDPF